LAHPSAQCAKKKNGAFGAHLAHPWIMRKDTQIKPIIYAAYSVIIFGV
jgi:hypothetical protein